MALPLSSLDAIGAYEHSKSLVVTCAREIAKGGGDLDELRAVLAAEEIARRELEAIIIEEENRAKLDQYIERIPRAEKALCLCGNPDCTMGV